MASRSDVCIRAGAFDAALLRRACTDDEKTVVAVPPAAEVGPLLATVRADCIVISDGS